MNTYNLTEIELTELLRKQRDICAAEYYTNAAPDRYYDDLCDTILNAPTPPLPISGAKKEDIPSKESQKQSLIELNAGTAEVTATPKPINNKN